MKITHELRALQTRNTHTREELTDVEQSQKQTTHMYSAVTDVGH